MYLDNEVAEGENYNASSGAFLKKYFKVSRYCGDDKTNCFASKYYNYENRTRKTYTFETKGSCAILKNGMSICISPQIGETPIQGWIDLNGKKGPNVLNRDLRSFSIDPQTKTALNTETKEIETIEKINCRKNPDSKECCEYQGINNDNKSYCCAYDGLNKDPLCCDVNGVNDSNHEYCCSLDSYYDNAVCCKYGHNLTNPICCDANGVNNSNHNFCCAQSSYYSNATCCRYGHNLSNPVCCGVNGINDSNHNFCCGQSGYSGTASCCNYGHNYNSAECCRQRGLASVSSSDDACCSLVPEFANNGACKKGCTYCANGGISVPGVGCVSIFPGVYDWSTADNICYNQHGLMLPQYNQMKLIREKRFNDSILSTCLPNSGEYWGEGYYDGQGMYGYFSYINMGSHNEIESLTYSEGVNKGVMCVDRY